MHLPPALRLALVPIGVAIAHKGLSYLSEEAERLDAAIEARRAALAGDPQTPDPATEDTAAEDLPGKSPARKVGALVANLAAFGAGCYLSMRAQRWLQDRAAAELAGELPEPGARGPLVDLDALARWTGAHGAHGAKCSGAFGDGPNPDCVLTVPHDGRPVFDDHRYPCAAADCPVCARVDAKE